MSLKKNSQVLADYVLCGDNERNDLKEQMDHCTSFNEAKRRHEFNKKYARKVAENHIYLTALRVRYGRRHAQKELTVIINEVKREH